MRREQLNEHEDSNDHDDGCVGLTGAESHTEARMGTESSADYGKLMLDATCAPANIAYPTDLSLSNEAREKLEKMIDVVYAVRKSGKRKPRTNRKKTRKAYLLVTRQRKMNPRIRHTATFGFCMEG